VQVFAGRCRKDCSGGVRLSSPAPCGWTTDLPEKPGKKKSSSWVCGMPVAMPSPAAGEGVAVASMVRISSRPVRE
jgi:hypothetical protein